MSLEITTRLVTILFIFALLATLLLHLTWFIVFFSCTGVAENGAIIALKRRGTEYWEGLIYVDAGLMFAAGILLGAPDAPLSTADPNWFVVLVVTGGLILVFLALQHDRAGAKDKPKINTRDGSDNSAK